MAKILDDLNKRLKNKLTLTEEEKYQAALETTEPIREMEGALSFRDFEQAKEEKEIVRINFESSDAEGNLYHYDKDSGITIVFLKDDVKKGMPYYDERNRSHFTGGNFTFEVHIGDIDRDTKRVYCTSARNPKTVMYTVKNALLKELEKGVRPVITGTVVKVKPDYILVDIFSRGIRGLLHTSKWSKAFTRTMEYKVHEGDCLQFEVLRLLKKDGNNTDCWELSRKNLTPNPWHMIPPHIKKDSVIAVKCIDKPENKSFWWGICDTFPNIEIMGNYTHSCNKERVLVGQVYQCKIADLKVEERVGDCVFKVSPFLALKEMDLRVIFNTKARKRNVETTIVKENTFTAEPPIPTAETREVEGKSEDILEETPVEATENEMVATES